MKTYRVIEQNVLGRGLSEKEAQECIEYNMGNSCADEDWQIYKEEEGEN